MKKFTVLLIFALIFSIGLEAQKSAVKLGLGGLFVTAPNLRFETALGDRMSFQITGSYKFPAAFNLNNDSDVRVTGDPKLSGFAIIPELRFYFGQANAGTIKGFYLGPYLKFHRYGTSSTLEYNYTDDNGVSSLLTPDFNVNLTTVGLGLQLGYHFIIGEHFTIDWHFLGFGGDFHRFGVKFNFKNSDVNPTDLANDLIDEVNFQLENNGWGDVDVDDLINLREFEQFIDGRKLRINVPFPFVGFRAGLSIGYAF